jgi:hypothetical protein
MPTPMMLPAITLNPTSGFQQLARLWLSALCNVDVSRDPARRFSPSRNQQFFCSD